MCICTETLMQYIIRTQTECYNIHLTTAKFSKFAIIYSCKADLRELLPVFMSHELHESHVIAVFVYVKQKMRIMKFVTHVYYESRTS